MSRQTANYPIPSSYKSHFIVASKYKLVRKIGSGSFGDIYLGECFYKKNIKFSFHHNNRDEHIEWGGGGNQA